MKNKETIATLKEDIKSESKEKQVEIEDQLKVLEQKNQSLKERIKDYRGSNNTKQEASKTEFNHDMDDLGQALKDLTQKNIK